MRPDLLIPATDITTASVTPGMTSFTALQSVLEISGWEDLRPAITAAEQVDSEIAQELLAAQTAYEEAQQEYQRRRLQDALEKALEKLQADYERVMKLKAEAEQRLTRSREASTFDYISQWGQWALSSLQQFFGSDKVSLVEHYKEIAQNRIRAIADLTRYQHNLEIIIKAEQTDFQFIEKGKEIEETQILSAQIEVHTTHEDSEINTLDEKTQKLSDGLLLESVEMPQSHARRLLMLNSDDFRVNTYTTENQFYPTVGTFSDGTFIVSWISSNQDGSGDGVYAQRYATNGIQIGGEFHVNTYTTSYQTDVSIGTFSNGAFIITWMSDSQDGSDEGIYAQRYAANGIPIGDEFRVNTYTIGTQENPSVGTFSDGAFIITWDGYGQDNIAYDVYAQRYAANGEALGSEFRVNTYTTGNQFYSTVKTFSDGAFIIAWRDDDQDHSGYGCYAQRYAASGIAVGNEFRVNTYTISDQYDPVVGTFSNGAFIITWISNYQDDGGSRGIYAQRYAANGIAIGSEFRVNTYISNDQTNPSVGTFRDGGFIISWESIGQDGSFSGVFAQRYAINGVAIGSEFRVNSYINNSQYKPSIGIFLDRGNFVVTWGGMGESDQHGIYARLFYPLNLINNTLSLNQNSSFILSTTMLSVSDNPSMFSQIHFTISNLTAGWFELTTSLGMAITQFTQQQISDGMVRFVHGGSDQAPSYQVSVTDGDEILPPVAADVRFNAFPRLINNLLSLKDNDTVVITPAMVNATDDTATARELQFLVEAVQNGRFEWMNSFGIAVTQFTQDQVQAAQVQFVHAGNNQAPTYLLSVSDGKLATSAQAASIDFIHRPVLTTHRLVINQGRATIITSSMLSASSDSSDHQVVFNVSDVQHGKFTLVSTPDVGITQFTQQEIKANQIQFVPDNSSIKPSYFLSLSDSSFTLPLVSGNVVFTLPKTFSPDWLLIGGVVGGTTLGLAFISLVFFLLKQKRMERNLCRALASEEEAKRAIVLQWEEPVMRAMIRQIKFLNICECSTEVKMVELRNAVSQIITHIQKDKDKDKSNTSLLEEAESPEEKNGSLKGEIIDQIVIQTKKRLVTDGPICSCGNFTRFFKAQTTTRQIRDAARQIATDVVNAVRINRPHRRSEASVELVQFDEKKLGTELPVSPSAVPREEDKEFEAAGEEEEKSSLVHIHARPSSDVLGVVEDLRLFQGSSRAGGERAPVFSFAERRFSSS